jgi:RNA-directed DNA polymerase
VVRFADDFIITANSKKWLQEVTKPRVIRFLAERGLKICEEKTALPP